MGPGQCGGQGKWKARQALGWPQSSSAQRAPCGGDVMAEECLGTVGVGRDGVGRRALWPEGPAHLGFPPGK